MTRIAYLDCPTGIAGDMCLGALVDAGVPLHYLQSQLALLGIKQEYQLSTERVQHNSLVGTKLRVQLLTDTDSSGASASNGDGHHHQDHGHEHSPGHDHNNEHSHDHQHSHKHGDGHSQEHSHEPQHSHGHSHEHSHDPHRHLGDIRALIQQAGLPPQVEAWSLAIFDRLAQAEAAVHGCALEAVHFHEVGATDAIVDIVGTCLGFHWLGVEQLYCSALPTGGGTVRAAHGRLPVPAPAVLRLFELGQVPVYSNGIARELVTPTGAAIATVLAGDCFGPPPAMTLQKVGLGAGTAQLPLPNMLRLWLGEQSAPALHSSSYHTPTQTSTQASTQTSTQASTQAVSEEHVTLLETQLDDLSPQAIGYVFEQLLAAGALDVFTRAIAMKKNRPGTLLTVICHAQQADALEAILFRETTTLGIRRQIQPRRTLSRTLQTVETTFGKVAIKIAWAEDPNTPLNVQPEYEDCARLARDHGQPWQMIHRLALEAWHQDHA